MAEERERTARAERAKEKMQREQAGLGLVTLGFWSLGLAGLRVQGFV